MDGKYFLPSNVRTYEARTCPDQYTRHEVTAPRVAGPSGRTSLYF
jgi:hypothetical protein